MPQFKTFEEFWPHYLREHSRPETRILHFAGTSVAAASLLGLLATRKKRYLLTALLGSYGPAWFAHAAFEHNKPATFDYPLWSLRADLLMYRKWLEGTLDGEIARLNATGLASRP